MVKTEQGVELVIGNTASGNGRSKKRPASRSAAANVRAPASGEAKRNAARTSRAILHAAIEEYADFGFGGARIEEIAARSDTNVRMIYHYFGPRKRCIGNASSSSTTRSDDRKMHSSSIADRLAMPWSC